MERQQKPTAAERDYKVFRSASAYILGGLVLVEMDTFMLGLFCPKQQVSVYSIAKQLISKATNVNMAVWTGTITSWQQ